MRAQSCAIDRQEVEKLADGELGDTEVVLLTDKKYSLEEIHSRMQVKEESSR